MAALIYERMSQILKSVDCIEKSRTNNHQGFKFRGIDDAMNTLHNVFAEAQVFLVHEVLDHSVTERTTAKGGVSFHHIVKVKFHFFATDGSSVTSVGIGEAADTGDKGAGKAMSYALKVCLLQSFLIPTEEDKDPDSASHTFWKDTKPVSVVKPAPVLPKKEDMVGLHALLDQKPDVFTGDKFVWEQDKALVNEAIKQLGINSKSAKEHGENLRRCLETKATTDFQSIKDETAKYFAFVGVLSNG